jgi:hypothetical protein
MTILNRAQPRRIKVKGAVVRELRRHQGLSRQDVVERLDGMGASLNEQKLKRIEDTRRDSYPVESKVAGDLATLLGTKLAVITGKEPLPDKSSSRDFLPEFSLPLPREFHNALAEVCFVYGVSPATVIANAPNPAGYSILRGTFPEQEISAAGLLIAALPPTVVAIILFRAF